MALVQQLIPFTISHTTQLSFSCRWCHVRSWRRGYEFVRGAPFSRLLCVRAGDAVDSQTPLRSFSSRKMVIEKRWREFFSDPSQWWDNRSEKADSRTPDFKHKKTHETLWIDNNLKPRWVEAELAALELGPATLRPEKGDNQPDIEQLQGETPLPTVQSLSEEKQPPKGQVHELRVEPGPGTLQSENDEKQPPKPQLHGPQVDTAPPTIPRYNNVAQPRVEQPTHVESGPRILQADNGTAQIRIEQKESVETEPRTLQADNGKAQLQVGKKENVETAPFTLQDKDEDKGQFEIQQVNVEAAGKEEKKDQVEKKDGGKATSKSKGNDSGSEFHFDSDDSDADSDFHFSSDDDDDEPLRMAPSAAKYSPRAPQLYNGGGTNYSQVEVADAELQEPESAETEKKKKKCACYHPVKLAIAFGLMSTDPGTTLRIVKNERCCEDCHHYAKFVAKMKKTEIILRDAKRFHHFKDGVCSCNDYW